MENQIYKLHAGICQALSHAKRIEIIDILQNGEMSQGELARKMKVAKANLSQHLSIMREKGIVTARREGINIYYHISSPKVVKACQLMREVLLDKLSQSGKIAKQMIAK
jgi:ArsR family transcriptional regulator